MNSSTFLASSVSETVLSTPSIDRALAAFSNSFTPNRITLDQQTGEVLINATHADNTSTVTQPNTQTIRVELVGIETKDFDISDVQSIRFLGRNGNDTFRNSTAVPTEAFGGLGDDVLFTGSGDDRLIGGPGNDRLEAGAGDDVLVGESGNDRLFGGSGADLLSGGNGNDSQNGGDGNDDIAGDNGDDVLIGGDGNDNLYGWFGNDTLFGQDGADNLYGNAGLDTLDGGTGNDRLFGGSEDDTLQGGSGEDFVSGELGNDDLRSWGAASILLGGHGDDTIQGSNFDDTLIGGAGNDVIHGRAGNDHVEGSAGDDQLFGDSGNDEIHGGNGNDIIGGNAGNDLLFGHSGADQLDGGNGRDYLRGGNAQDTLFGGVDGQVDQLFGDSGQDHILYFQQDDQGTDRSDLRLQFVNRTSNWTTEEIFAINEGMQWLHSAAGNNSLVTDRIVGQDLQLEKYRQLEGGAAALNYMRYSGPLNDLTYERQIRFADWDESVDAENHWRSVAFVHEVAHNFDNDFELTATPGVSEQDWNAFLSISLWRETRTNSNFILSDDGQWYYHQSAEFYRSYSTTNPAEDWATAWELYFDPTADKPAASTNLGRKVAAVANFVDKIS